MKNPHSHLQHATASSDLPSNVATALPGGAAVHALAMVINEAMEAVVRAFKK